VSLRKRILRQPFDALYWHKYLCTSYEMP